MAIEVIVEFFQTATVRTRAYVYDDDDELVNPTSIKVTIVEPDGGRSGTATALLLNHLVDTTKKQFVAGDVGKTVYNTTDETTAEITVVTSSSDVTLDTDIMAEGEGYKIYCAYAEDMDDLSPAVDGTFDHYLLTDANYKKGWYQGQVDVLDTAKRSIGKFSFRIK